MASVQVLENRQLTDQLRPLPEPLRIFFNVALVLNLIGLACESVALFALHLGMPYILPILTEAWAVDLTNYIRLFPYLHTAGFFQTIRGITYEYPAPVAPLYGLFLRFPNPVHTLEWTLFFMLGSAASAFALHLHRKGLNIANAAWVAGGAFVLSYPAAFELKQGNMELFVVALVGVGVYCLVRGKNHSAAVCIAVAGSMKIFPFVYLGLFLTRSRYRALGTALVSTVVVTLASLYYLDPSITEAWHGVGKGLTTYQLEITPIIRLQTAYDHSIFALIKLAHFGFTDISRVPLETVQIYLAVVAAVGIALFCFRIRHMPMTNQVICLCVASIILPPVSYDYTLLHLYIPWAMLVCFAIDMQNLKTAGLTASFICLAIATSIQSEVIFNGRSFGGQIKAVALCVLMLVVLVHPFRKGQHRDGETEAV